MRGVAYQVSERSLLVHGAEVSIAYSNNDDRQRLLGRLNLRGVAGSDCGWVIVGGW